jgi:hypothetical protein
MLKEKYTAARAKRDGLSWRSSNRPRRPNPAPESSDDGVV